MLTLLPNPLQCLPKEFGLGWDAQQVLWELGSETPEPNSSSNGKHRPGHQHPQGIGRHAAYFLTPSWDVVPCCPFI